VRSFGFSKMQNSQEPQQPQQQQQPSVRRRVRLESSDQNHSPPRPGPSRPPLAIPEEYELFEPRPPRNSRWPRPATPPPRRRPRARYQIEPTLGDNPPDDEGPPPYDSVVDPPPPYTPFPPSSFSYVSTHSERRKKKFDRQ